MLMCLICSLIKRKLPPQLIFKAKTSTSSFTALKTSFELKALPLVVQRKLPANVEKILTTANEPRKVKTLTGRKSKTKKTWTDLKIKAELRAHSEKRLLDEMKIAETITSKRVNMAMLSSCLHVTCMSDAPDMDLALKTLDKVLSITQKNSYQRRLSMFNSVLIGLARQGRYDQCLTVLELMKNKKVKPSLSTVSALLQACHHCASFPTEQDRLQAIWKTLDYAKSNDLVVENVLKSGVHGVRESEYVLNTIRLVLPEYKPRSHRRPTSSYDSNCSLLDKLKNDPSTSDQQQHQPYLEDGPYANVLDKERLYANFKQQLGREIRESFDLPNAVGRGTRGNVEDSPKRLKAKIQAEQWRENIIKNFRRKIEDLKAEQSALLNDAVNGNGDIFDPKKQSFYLPFLTCLDAEKFVDILHTFTTNLAELTEAHIQVFTLRRMLCKTVYSAYVSQIQLNSGMHLKLEAIYKEYLDYFVDPNLSQNYNQREYWQKASRKCFPDQPHVFVRVHAWPDEITDEVGKILLNLIVDSALVEKDGKQTKALYSSYNGVGARSREEMQADDAFLNIVKSLADYDLPTEPRDSPMCCPPVPWTKYNDGFFLFKNITLIRTPGPFSKYGREIFWKLKQHCAPAPNKLFPALDTLNQLGATPWRINEPILDIAMKLFSTGFGCKSLDIPTHPLNVQINSPANDNKREKRLYRFNLKKATNEAASLYSTVLRRLCLADFFRKEVIWFPHSLDFRGRAYPVPPHLNHMGDDLCRSLLLFAKGRKLGEKGLDWLLIHCINLTGKFKRESVDNRLQYAKSILEDILDSADDPLGGRKWWQASEDPWETLACCMEIAKATRCPEGAENFVSFLPVHQDGCCNGLQHYAALGRDEDGASQVNLIKRDLPQDVYTGVLEMVLESCRRDAEKGSQLARDVTTYVERKTIKQTVMTICYGVTMYGAKLQIKRQLKDRGFPEEHLRRAADYLAKRTFDSIGELFRESRKIQRWFERCAGVLAGECRKPVQWITPLGFPVLQPYFRLATVKSPDAGDPNGDGGVTTGGIGSRLDVPVKLKQTQAFPPNFIHSLDSTHMMLTALFCQRAGVTYASVHDCYWTHASTVDQMNVICREQFIELYNQNILQDLAEYFRQESLKLFGPLTPKVDFDDDDVMSDSCGLDEESHVMTSTSGDHESPSAKIADAEAGVVVSSLETQQAMMDYLNRVFLSIPGKGNFDLNNVKRSTYFFS